MLGATGSGKTNLILGLLRQDLARRHSVAVVDLRGDLVERALALCADEGVASERVVLLDLREPKWVVGFNPLRSGAEPFVRALHLLDVIRGESDSWGVQLEETMRSAFLLLAHADQAITDLESLLFDLDYLSDLVATCNEPSITQFFSRYAALSEEKQLAFALPVMNKVTPLLATPGLRAVLGSARTIDLDSVLNRRGTVLLVSLAVDELHRSSRMLGALIVSAISRVMCSRVTTPEAKRNPVRLYVDEFEAMASASFEGLIAEGRRFKLSLVLSHQNLAQLPPKLRSIIRNNVGLQILGRCGFQDAEDLRRELPDNLTAEDLVSLQPGQMLLMSRGEDAQLIRTELAVAQVGAAEAMEYRARVLREIGTPITEVTEKLQAKRRAANRPHFDESGPWGLEDEPWS